MQHLRAILWLRWRMSFNQWRRSGSFNAIVTMAFVIFAVIASAILFFAALIGGSLVLISQEPAPDTLMLTWDVIVLVFLFAWLIGLITELQRSELLSLDRLLHLPLSLSGAFLLNYVSSLLSLPVVVFLPGMLGLALACIIAYGLPMLTILPLLASFMLLVTAVTYQIRGWLATLMENKRRRKTIVVAITMTFVLMAQAPQLLNFAVMGNSNRRNQQRSQEHQQAVAALTRQLQAGEISAEEVTRGMKDLEEQRKGLRVEANAQGYRDIVGYVLLANKVLPIGWFPYGVRAAALGNTWPGILASLAMFSVGGVSLWRSYAVTLRFYTKARSAPRRTVKKAKPEATPRLPDSQRTNLLESQFPCLSEHVAAVGLASFRSLLRAPEAKMALMTPVILACAFGGMIVLGPGKALRGEHSSVASPFIAIVIIGVTLLGLSQLAFNIFGMDRGGFRAFVLMPVSRRDILLGKNLSIAPIGGGIVVVLLVALQFVFTMRVTHLLATLVQLVPSYLILCVIGNTASILAPLAVASGSLKPAQPKVGTMLLQMLFMTLAPISLLPGGAALGAETLLALTTSVSGLPIYLAFSLVEAGLVIWLYREVITRQGQWLQKREPRILEILEQIPE